MPPVRVLTPLVLSGLEQATRHVIELPLQGTSRFVAPLSGSGLAGNRQNKPAILRLGKSEADRRAADANVAKDVMRRPSAGPVG